MTPATAAPIERGRRRAAIAHFTQAVTSWALGLNNAEIRIVVFDGTVSIAHVAQHPTRSFVWFTHCRCYLEVLSVRGAAPVFAAHWATPQLFKFLAELRVLFLVIPQFFVVIHLKSLNCTD